MGSPPEDQNIRPNSHRHYFGIRKGPVMTKIVNRNIDRQMAVLTEAGYPLIAILLARNKYTELLQEQPLGH